MTFKEQVAKVKTLLSSVFEDIQPAAGETTGANTLQDYTTDGGVNVKIDKLEAGGMVYMEDGATPVTTGFTLADGSIVAVDGNGVITAVTVPVEASAPVQPVAPVAAPSFPAGFEERFTAVEKEVADLKAVGALRFEHRESAHKTHDDRIAKLADTVKQTLELVEAFAAQPSEDPAQTPSGAPDKPSKAERREAFAKTIAQKIKAQPIK